MSLYEPETTLRILLDAYKNGKKEQDDIVRFCEGWFKSFYTQGKRKTCEHPTGHCKDGYDICNHCGAKIGGDGHDREDDTLTPSPVE
jgi:hypothetical protein